MTFFRSVDFPNLRGVLREGGTAADERQPYDGGGGVRASVRARRARPAV
jgi:hypothetical protein